MVRVCMSVCICVFLCILMHLTDLLLWLRVFTYLGCLSVLSNLDHFRTTTVNMQIRVYGKVSETRKLWVRWGISSGIGLHRLEIIIDLLMELSVSAQLPGAGWLTGTGMSGPQPTRRNHSPGWREIERGITQRDVGNWWLFQQWSREKGEERVREREGDIYRKGAREANEWEVEQKWVRAEKGRWWERQTVGESSCMHRNIPKW